MQPLTRDDPAEIAGYRLQARLGAGGMGQVYLATTPAGRSVALKVVRSELSQDRDFRARFRQEIQAARRVHGLYTAQLLDADPAATPPWLVTAYVPGPSLQQAVTDHGPMPPERVFRLVAGIAEALQGIHSAGIVHRDLKPSNVLLAPDGPRVIDFGIARALEATSLTRTGMMVGSPMFMAPEQIMDRPVSPAIDVFALGSLAAYAALGRTPFGDGHVAAISYRVLHERPDLGGCAPPLRTLIEPCLAKQPGDRPALGEIIEFCRAQVPAPVDARRPAPVPAAVARPAAPRGQAPPRPAAAPQRSSAPQARAARPPAGVMASHGSPPPAATAGPTQNPPVSPARPIPPAPVAHAVRLMYAGAAVAASSIFVGVAAGPALKAIGHPGHFTTGGALTLLIVRALVSAALWVWAARRARRGRAGLRGMCTVLFGFDTFAILHTYAQGLAASPVWFVSLAEWGVGLAAIVLLWERRSNGYFTELTQARQLATPHWRSAPP